METRLVFIMEKVKMGNQKRYQQWFIQSYLTAPESETLIVDLIRFICGVYHPSNAILASNMVPRWAMIGWLLKCIKVMGLIKRNYAPPLMVDRLRMWQRTQSWRSSMTGYVSIPKPTVS